ncbi:hypothetical protein TWF718_008100 [Orbilia javanica]|uniref:Uncharacterized protein n=1 Tax=Orbilia javanica TaxID=47235 RepID=A0AAN8MMK8_9PEZI
MAEWMDWERRDDINAVEEDQPRAQRYKIESREERKEGTSYDNPDITNHVIPFFYLLLLPFLSLPDNLFFHNYYYILYRNGVWKIDFTFLFNTPTYPRLSHTLYTLTKPHLLQSACLFLFPPNGTPDGTKKKKICFIILFFYFCMERNEVFFRLGFYSV